MVVIIFKIIKTKENRMYLSAGGDNPLIPALIGRGRWTSVSPRPAWSAKGVLRQPEIHRETLFRK